MTTIAWPRAFLASDLWRNMVSFPFSLAIIVVGIWNYNALPIIALISLASYFGVEPKHLRKFWHRTGVGCVKQQEGYSTLTVVTLIFASSFFLVSIPFFSALHIVERGDGRVEYHGRFAVTTLVPFKDTVRGYDEDQSVVKRCAGVTSDRHHVLAADVYAALRVTPESLPKVRARSLDRFDLEKAVSSELCARFSSVISGYALENIPLSTVIGARILEKRDGMEDLGVSYVGEVSVKKLRASAVM